MGRRAKDYDEKQLHIGNFNLKELQKYIDENNISDINATMLQVMAKLSNEYINQLETNGLSEKSMIPKNLLSTFQLINKILKDNNLTLEKKCVNTPKEKEKDGIELLIDNLNKVKDAV